MHFYFILDSGKFKLKNVNEIDMASCLFVQGFSVTYQYGHIESHCQVVIFYRVNWP